MTPGIIEDSTTILEAASGILLWAEYFCGSPSGLNGLLNLPKESRMEFHFLRNIRACMSPS